MNMDLPDNEINVNDPTQRLQPSSSKLERPIKVENAASTSPLKFEEEVKPVLKRNYEAESSSTEPIKQECKLVCENGEVNGDFSTNRTGDTRTNNASSDQCYAQSTPNKKPRLVKEEDVGQSSNHAKQKPLDRSRPNRVRCKDEDKDDGEFPAIQRVTCTTQKINKTNVQECYLLNENDLIGLDRETRFWQPPTIPAYVWAPMYLYREQEIERLAWERYGGYHGFLEALYKRARRRKSPRRKRMIAFPRAYYEPFLHLWRQRMGTRPLDVAFVKTAVRDDFGLYDYQLPKGHVTIKAYRAQNEP